MDNIDPRKQNIQADEEEDFEDDEEEDEYDDMELLERLETLREDMEELGVTSLGQINQRIKELHRQLDKR